MISKLNIIFNNFFFNFQQRLLNEVCGLASDSKFYWIKISLFFTLIINL